MKPAEGEFKVDRDGADVGRAGGDIGNDGDPAREFIPPHLQFITVIRCMIDLREIVVLHGFPRADEVHDHIPLPVDRDEDVVRFVARAPGALEFDEAARMDRNTVGCDSQIVADNPEGQAGIKPVFEPDQKRDPPKHAVPVALQREKPYAPGGGCKPGKGDQRLQSRVKILRIAFHANFPEGLAQICGNIRGDAIFHPVPCGRQSEGHAEVDVAGRVHRLYHFLVFSTVGFGGEDDVERLRGRAHGAKIPDHLGIVGTREVKRSEAPDRRIIEVYVNDRGVVGGSEIGQRRSYQEEPVENLGVPGLDRSRKKPEQQLGEPERRGRQGEQRPYPFAFTGGQWYRSWP